MMANLLKFLILIAPCWVQVHGTFYGDEYYNDRYGDQGIAYTSTDRLHGLWSDQPSVLKGPYLLDSSEYEGEVCTGCVCDNGAVTSCDGPTVELKGQTFTQITAGMFNSTVTSIKILSCPNFESFEDGTFTTLTNLQSLIIQDTVLNHVPDLSNTQVQIVNLASNKIKITGTNHDGWSLPANITHLALMNNEIHWFPQGAISGPNLRIVSFSYNQFTTIQDNIFGDVSALTYLGLDGNRITRLSKKNLKSLASSNLYHLNCSNNALSYLQVNVFSQIPQLKILELHNNLLTTMERNVFSDMTQLLHLDLHKNKIVSLSSRSLENLPSLMELRLHSQNSSLTTIAHDAWNSIGSELVYLFLSDNGLTSFPHPVMEKENYPKLEIIFADHNQITNITGYGEEAFSLSHRSLYQKNLAKFHHAFTQYPSLHTLYLGDNLISVIENTTFCNLTNLTSLFLMNNQLTETTIPDDAFTCITNLTELDLEGNLIQYIPNALSGSESLPAIQSLNLNNNKLRFLEAGAFVNHTTLTALQLNGNGIIAIEDGAFPDVLTSLSMNNNDFRFLHQHTFANLANLQTLDLSYNQIDYIPAKAFENCTSLTHIQLSYNQISQLLKSHFTYCPLSGDLLFDNNNIGWIEDGTFAHITSLGSLDLSNNELTKLPVGGDFENMTIQTSLDFSQNRINSLSSNVFKNLDMPSNNTLQLSNNKITRIESEAFYGVVAGSIDFQNNSLRELQTYSFKDVQLTETLNLNELQFTDIPTKAFYNVFARNIDLSSSGINTIQTEAFFNVTLMEDLDLSNNAMPSLEGAIFGGFSLVNNSLKLMNNSLSGISIDAFNNLAVTHVWLTNNQLTVYPQALQSLNPTSIYLDNNLVSEISDGSLTGMTDLVTLNLNNNQLVKLQTELLVDLTSLQYLYLDNNTLETLEAGVFDNLTSLLYLSVANNRLTHFPALGPSPQLQYVDLSNNEIETFGDLAFNNSPALMNLDVSNNPLGCTCQLIEIIDAVRTAVVGGTCQFPVATDSITLNVAMETDSSYYLNSNMSLFQCTGENINATGVSGAEISVIWDQPTYLYINFNDVSGSSQLLEGNITYTITCVSTSAASLEDTITVYDYIYNASAGPSSLTLTFDTNIVALTTYECSVKLKQENYTSAKSLPSVVTTPALTATNATTQSNVTDQSNTTDTNGTDTSGQTNGTDTGGSNTTDTSGQSNTTDTSGGTAGPGDIELPVIYHDFSKTHPDFDNVGVISFSTPTYVASPYGAWLSVSSHPTTDTFSQWFRHNQNINHEITSTLIVTAQNGTIKRYSSDKFFPLDDLGYGSEQQLDINGTYHNFGFTSVIRTGLVFNGTEKITVGGGEALWLYINKVLVIEIVSTSTDCYRIDLSPAAIKGGGTIVPEAGDITGGICTGLSPLSTGAELELEVGEIYHFDLFHAETTQSTSELLFEVEDTTFMTDSSTMLPIDYTVTIAEDFFVGDTVETIYITDAFSQGGYDITLYKGNEARQFEIKDTLANQFTAPTVTLPVYRTTTDRDGNTVSYVECNTSSTSTKLTSNNNASETYTITTSTALFTLKDDLDYETTTSYYLLMSVVDTGLSPQLTGFIAIRVVITDVNDNCPELTPTTVTLTPVPALVTEALVTFNISDIDSGENANIHFVISTVIERPSVTSNTSCDFGDDIINDTDSTTLQFQVIAMDNGTIPLGTSAEVNLTISNNCLNDAKEGAIVYKLFVNDSTGELFLRIPKYFKYPYECKDVIGLENGAVLDSMISASSSYHVDHTGPERARLNWVYEEFGALTGGWVAGINDTDPYIEVDMNEPMKYSQVYIQGRQDAAEWVTSFKIFYDSSNGTLMEYYNGTGENIFLGNIDNGTVTVVDLDPVIESQIVRIYPQTWYGSNISMRLELYGCSQVRQLCYDKSCFRCEMSYFCEGDGERNMCGRCDSTVSSCDRDPSEHSFGLASQCSSCPNGWVHEVLVLIPKVSSEGLDKTAHICSLIQAFSAYTHNNGVAAPCNETYYVDYCNSTYCPTSCSQCEPGYACLDGRRTICDPGTFSDGTLQHCQSCAAGTFTNQSGQSSCLTCEPGYYSAAGMYACSPCGEGEYSTAGVCTTCADDQECPCMANGTCFDNVLCVNRGSGDYTCGGCPVGYEGDGVSCTDIDECEVYKPCYNQSCLNTAPGYQCYACPDGYSGSFEDAYAWDVNQRVYDYMNLNLSSSRNQTCDDIDECAVDNGGCGTGVTCVNTEGSYKCEACGDGYLGSVETGCYLADFCASGSHDCSSGANCIYIGPAQYRCECNVGYGGKLCVLDSDNDGWSDSVQSCTDRGCAKDNCPSVPNSNQEDTDGDTYGDSCDDDDDNDRINDNVDNCQYVSNTDQADGDGDSIGEVCDNCPGVANSDQTDSDGDGAGDICDPDDDNDDLDDSSDNCPYIANVNQTDTDGDGVGDACDNCVNDINADQTDTDMNGVGDICDTPGVAGEDQDGDGILDSMDNCVSYANGDQSDIDVDGIGDLCDTDIDGDGVVNTVDNCAYLSNAAQTDSNSDGVGDDCETDSDGDGAPDYNDTCPFNPSISRTSFKSHFTVDLYPSLNTSSPAWLIKSDEVEVLQTTNTGMPTMLIGDQSYGAIEYRGTWYMSESSTNDYIGFVFGYQNNRKFYLAAWKRTHSNYDITTNYTGGIKGMQIKLVDSTTGPGEALAEALWHSHDTADQVTILWHDPTLQGWKTETSYRWVLTHRPSTGYISLQVYHSSSQILDTGAIYNSAISGGRVGVFQFGDFPVTWSYLKVTCLEHHNQGLYFDGIDDYVELDDIPTLEMEESFTVELWLSLDVGYTTGSYPLLCSNESVICVWIENSVVHGRYGNSMVSGSTTLTAGTWHNIIFRHSIEDQTLTIFVDSVQDAVVSGVNKVNFTERGSVEGLVMYLGKDNATFFKGTLDEVRLYSIAIEDSQIIEHIGYSTLEIPILKSYGNVHFRMEESSGATTLTNSGSLSATANLSGGRFVTSYQQYNQFRITNPNNRR